MICISLCLPSETAAWQTPSLWNGSLLYLGPGAGPGRERGLTGNKARDHALRGWHERGVAIVARIVVLRRIAVSYRAFNKNNNREWPVRAQTSGRKTTHELERAQSHS